MPARRLQRLAGARCHDAGRRRAWGLTLTLDPEREYQFRYLVNGTSWQNDAAADKYVPNAYGDDNSVVVT